MRRSKSIEALMASITAEGPAAKRPPHIVFAPVAGAGFPPAARWLWSVTTTPDSRENRPMRVPLALAALLYGVIAASANAEPLDAAGIAALEALRTGEMEKVVLHDEPRPALSGTFQDAEGDEVSLSDFGGRVVLLNFWATWCPPCRAEMPSIDRLAGEMAGDGLAVIALSSDRGGPERIAEFFAEIGVVNLSIHQDPRGELQRAAGAIGLPVTLLLDREGREVARVTGDAVWDSPEAKALIGRLVELTAPEG
jgi:thiol-disulfide isomerase/thioredoxin